MKKVINGKLYDTGTAEEIWSVRNYLPEDFPFYLEEGLYKTKKGAFFLAGSGGTLTKYCQKIDGKEQTGSNIFPLSKEQALKWCIVENVDHEILKKYFGIEEA